MDSDAIATSANNPTAHFENGVLVYPCRCGETHRGEYAAYDFGHHECLHDVRLILETVAAHPLAICPACGKSWQMSEAVCELESGP